MKLPLLFLIIGILYITAFGLHANMLQKTVYGDGIFYYSWLRSVVVDRDIDFTNEYAVSGVSQPKTSSGMFGNKYSIGPALLWAPAFLWTHQLVRGDGWELPYQITVGLSSVLASLFGLALVVRLLSPSWTIVPVLILITGATNLLFYGAIDNANSHALSFFASAVFLSFIMQSKKNSIAIGAALGLLALIRLQDIVFILLLLTYKNQIKWRSFFTGFLMSFAPQLIAWISLYGTLANPYITGGETFSVGSLHILGVLFGAQSGIFLWTPVVLLGITGLLLGYKKYWSYLLVCFVELLIVASWSTWTQGASYSGRMFVSILPIIAIGLSHITERMFTKTLLRRILPILSLSLVVMNVLGILYFLFTT